MAGLTKVQAINMLMAAIGLRPVAAVDSTDGVYGHSEAADAERYIDLKSSEVQEEGWTENTEEEISLSPPDIQISLNEDLSGIFLAGETVTESNSGATGRYHQTSTYMYLTTISGIFTGGETLTGGTSGATQTGNIATAITEGEICLDYDILRADSSGNSEGDDIVSRGGKLYSRDDNTFVFSDSVDITQIRQLEWDDLTPVTKNLITARARQAFQRRRRGNRLADAYLGEEEQNATSRAKRAASENEDVNILDSNYMQKMLGSGSIDYR